MFLWFDICIFISCIVGAFAIKYYEYMPLLETGYNGKLYVSDWYTLTCLLIALGVIMTQLVIYFSMETYLQNFKRKK
jgi:hypothetical protein